LGSRQTQCKKKKWSGLQDQQVPVLSTPKTIGYFLQSGSDEIPQQIKYASRGKTSARSWISEDFYDKLIL